MTRMDGHCEGDAASDAAACEVAVGKRAQIGIFGTDWSTPEGTGIRDYIHVDDPARAQTAALADLRAGGRNETLNCGYGHGASVRELLAAVGRAERRTDPCARAAPPCRRCRRADCARRAHPAGARLDAAARRPRLHRTHRTRVGAPLAGARWCMNAPGVLGRMLSRP